MSLTDERECDVQFDHFYTKMTIIENDACDHFIKLQEEIYLISNLTELKIQSMNGCKCAHPYVKDC